MAPTNDQGRGASWMHPCCKISHIHAWKFSWRPGSDKTAEEAEKKYT